MHYFTLFNKNKFKYRKITHKSLVEFQSTTQKLQIFYILPALNLPDLN
jgi:hypothetical protein